MTPGVETMVEECFQKHGRKCININNEGQWLLDGTFGCSVEYGIALLTVHASGAVGPLKHAVNSVYGPGRVCEPPVDGPLLDQVKSHIVSKWFGYWRNSSRIVVQKSPQDLLKLSFIDSMFRPFTTSRRFIIIIKHPATLNTALPKNMDWMYEITTNGKKKHLSNAKINENFRYFHRMMTRQFVNDSISSELTGSLASSGRCNTTGPGLRSFVDLGWLPAWEYFHIKLKSIGGPVRLVRYEDLVLDPYGFCAELISFAVGSQDAHQIDFMTEQICDRHFLNLGSINNLVTGRRQVKPLGPSLGRFREAHAHRSLRLRMTEPSDSDINTIGRAVPKGYTEINFRRDLATASIVDRLGLLRSAVGFAKGGSSPIIDGHLTKENKKLLLSMEVRLRPLGYSLLGQSPGVIMKDRDYASSATYLLKYYNFAVGYLPYLSNAYQSTTGAVF